mgnify:CR=1 FL=1
MPFKIYFYTGSAIPNLYEKVPEDDLNRDGRLRSVEIALWAPVLPPRFNYFSYG